MCEFSAYVAFNKATNGRVDIKHKKENKFSWMSLLKIAVEKLPPSQRSGLENYTLFCLVYIKKRSFLTSCVFWFALQSLHEFFVEKGLSYYKQWNVSKQWIRIVLGTDILFRPDMTGP